VEHGGRGVGRRWQTCVPRGWMEPLYRI
jgi:hypothetical protein